METKAATYEAEDLERRGVRWIYPRCETIKTYSKPWMERTGKRPVRSEDDHSLL